MLKVSRLKNEPDCAGTKVAGHRLLRLRANPALHRVHARGNRVAWAHAVQRSFRRGRVDAGVIVDGAWHSSIRIVRHIHLQRSNGREHPNADPRGPHHVREREPRARCPRASTTSPPSVKKVY